MRILGVRLIPTKIPFAENKINTGAHGSRSLALAVVQLFPTIGDRDDTLFLFRLNDIVNLCDFKAPTYFTSI